MPATNHTYTWLKIFLAAYALELVYFCINSHLGIAFFAEAVSYLIVFLVTVTGLVIGLLLNLPFKFRRAAMIYIIGQVLVVSGMMYLFQSSKEDTAQAARLHDEELLTEPAAYSQDKAKAAMEQVIYLMEEQYPFGAYNIADISTAFVNGDSNGNKGITCTIIFTLQEEGNQKFASRYLIKGDSLSPMFIKEQR